MISAFDNAIRACFYYKNFWIIKNLPNKYHKACIIPFAFVYINLSRKILIIFSHKVASDEKFVAEPHILVVVFLHFLGFLTFLSDILLTTSLKTKDVILHFWHLNQESFSLCVIISFSVTHKCLGLTLLNVNSFKD